MGPECNFHAQRTAVLLVYSNSIGKRQTVECLKSIEYAHSEMRKYCIITFDDGMMGTFLIDTGKTKEVITPYVDLCISSELFYSNNSSLILC